MYERGCLAVKVILKIYMMASIHVKPKTQNFTGNVIRIEGEE